jgi:cbb3-type cytochrome oxidase subunit 3
MLQYLLLFLNLLVLGATAYLYWTTRNTVDEEQAQNFPQPVQPGWVQSPVTLT